MNAVQIAFVCALSAMLLAVAGFSGVVLRAAVRGGRVVRLGGALTAREHGELGRLAFICHRLTGFAIFAFLCLHILDVALVTVSSRLYDDVQSLYGTAALRVLECGLLFAVLFHTANGLRLLAYDFLAVSPAASRRLLDLVLCVTVTAGAAGSILILAPLFLMMMAASESTSSRPAAWEVIDETEAGEADPSFLVDYVVLRLTGLALSVLVLGHFVVTHLTNDVARDDSAFVARQLSSVLWIAWDAAMLAAALAHGATGVRVALADYALGTRRRRVLERTIWSLCVVLFALGLFVIARASRG